MAEWVWVVIVDGSVFTFADEFDARAFEVSSRESGGADVRLVESPVLGPTGVADAIRSAFPVQKN